MSYVFSLISLAVVEAKCNVNWQKQGTSLPVKYSISLGETQQYNTCLEELSLHQVTTIFL